MDTRYYDRVAGDMFDFRDFYFGMAMKLPDNAVIAEVGNADGKSALYLAGALTELEKKFTLYMIDNMAYGGMDQMYTIIDNVVEAGMPGIRVRKWDSLEAAEKFPNDHFDLIFLDSSHLYLETKKEIVAWYPKLKENAYLAGHDYLAHAQVRKAVDEIIPHEIVRTDIPGRSFPPKKYLHIENTGKGYGVWCIKRKFYVNLHE
jgi:hypothetical protein